MVKNCFKFLSTLQPCCFLSHLPFSKMKSKMLLSKLFFVISLLTFINCSESDKVVENDSDSEGMCTGKGPENCGGEKDEKHGEIKTSSKIVGDEDKNHSDEEMEAELKEEQTEEQEYRKGSACSYCSYCKVPFAFKYLIVCFKSYSHFYFIRLFNFLLFKRSFE